MLKRQSEIEIYVRDSPPERLVAWMELVVGPLAPAKDARAATVYSSRIGPVVVRPGIEGGPFVGVCFNSSDSPWATDVDCARQACMEFGYVVRCCPGQHYPGVPWWASDQFLEIAGGVEQIVTWECAEQGATEDGGRDTGLS